MTNLVNNAIKFTKKGGISIRTTKQNDLVQVTVQDSGPGIKEDDIARLFHEFEQLSNRKTGGTGLGLAISRKIIQKHNGRIWAESEFGKGTSFCFALPVGEQIEMGQLNVKENISC